MRRHARSPAPGAAKLPAGQTSARRGSHRRHAHSPAHDGSAPASAKSLTRQASARGGSHRRHGRLAATRTRRQLTPPRPTSRPGRLRTRQPPSPPRQTRRHPHATAARPATATSHAAAAITVTTDSSSRARGHSPPAAARFRVPQTPRTRLSAPGRLAAHGTGQRHRGLARGLCQPRRQTGSPHTAATKSATARRPADARRRPRTPGRQLRRRHPPRDRAAGSSSGELPARRSVWFLRSDSHRAAQGEPVQVPRRRACARSAEGCRQSIPGRRRWPAAGAVDLG